METEYDRDILPFRENDPEGEVFDCLYCREPVSEEMALMVKTDEQIYEAAHPACFKQRDPWAFWMSRM